MSTLKTQDQGIIELLQTDYLPILIESFLIDRKSQGLSIETIRFYQKKLRYFEKYCDRCIAHLYLSRGRELFTYRRHYHLTYRSSQSNNKWR